MSNMTNFHDDSHRQIVPKTVNATLTLPNLTPLDLLQQETHLASADIRKQLLEGTQGLVLAQHAINTIANAAKLPIHFQCPHCQQYTTLQPQPVTKQQLQAATTILNHTAGKPVERHERVLKDQEYAAITLKAITAVLPTVTKQQLQRIGELIVQELSS